MPPAKAKRRILLHVGFHKTGTTSLQDCLQGNAERLAPLWRVETLQNNPALRAVTKAARDYSLSREQEDLDLFQAEVVLWLAGLDLAPEQGLMISSEDFAGHMPGVGPVRRYDALGPIVAAFVSISSAFFSGRVSFHVLITSRAAAPWLRSLHWQQAKGPHQTQDFDEFAADLAKASDHLAIAQSLRQQIAPWPVTLTALETVQECRLGPAEALLGLADLPEAMHAALTPAPLRNAAPAAYLCGEFVALNRMGLGPEELKRRKDGLRRTAVSTAAQLR